MPQVTDLYLKIDSLLFCSLNEIIDRPNNYLSSAVPIIDPDKTESNHICRQRKHNAKVRKLIWWWNCDHQGQRWNRFTQSKISWHCPLTLVWPRCSACPPPLPISVDYFCIGRLNSTANRQECLPSDLSNTKIYPDPSVDNKGTVSPNKGSNLKRTVRLHLLAIQLF